MLAPLQRLELQSKPASCQCWEVFGDDTELLVLRQLPVSRLASVPGPGTLVVSRNLIIFDAVFLKGIS